MKNKTVIWATISLLFLVVFGAYIILENATYLDWGEYKVPEYPVGGSEVCHLCDQLTDNTFVS